MILSGHKLRPIVIIYTRVLWIKLLMLRILFRISLIQAIRTVGVAVKYVWYNQKGYGADRLPLVKIIHLSKLVRPLRDSLVMMHAAEHQALSEGRSWVWMVFLFDEGERRVVPGDLLSAVHRVSKVTQLHMFWSKDSAAGFIRRYAHEEIREHLLAKVSDASISDKIERQNLTSFNNSAGGANLYSLPHAVEVKGRDFLKLLNPGSVIAVVSLPPYDAEELAAYSEKRKWLEMIVAAARKIPKMQLVVVGFVSPWHDDLHALAGNATLTSSLGFSLSEEMAIAKHADLFVGSMDHFAALAIDAGKPCMIIGENERARDGVDQSETYVREFPEIELGDVEKMDAALISFLREAKTMGRLTIAGAGWLERVGGDA